MKEDEEDEFFDLLEAGKTIKARAEDGKLVALFYFEPEPDCYWRTAWFESNWIPDRKCYFDSRERDYPDFYLPWERYAEAALAAKEAIEAGLMAKPAPPAPAPLASAPAPVTPLPAVAKPEQPKPAQNLQQEPRREMEHNAAGYDRPPPPPPAPKSMSVMQFQARLRAQKRGTNEFWLAHSEWQAAKAKERER
jgi:hypothetical protein